MVFWIILGVVYYIISSLLFLYLLEKETVVGILSRFSIVMSFIPIIRFIYYIYFKFM